MALQVYAHKQVVENLGKAAKGIDSRFSCGGVLSSPSKIEVLYKKPSGDWSQHPVVFPGASESDLLNLIDVCSIASFGFDGKDVIDHTYRDALKLDPQNFMTSFQLGSTDILNEISSLMVPDNINMSSGVQAELYKLNIYSNGGHFKAHVDTPRSPLMFGSLVLCLPLPFTGGSLVTRHQGQQICFDWSSSPETTNDKICWASFFSDVEHEVLPVTSGHRVTLTYNLYQNFKMETLSTFHVTAVPLYTELCTALQTPHFMRQGGILGFGCQHVYVMKDLNKTEILPRLLKGSDRIVYNVSKSLGLSVAVKSIARDKRWIKWALPKFSKFVVRDEYEYEKHDDMFAKMFGNPFSTTNITWCHDLSKWKPIGAALTYGNEIPPGQNFHLYHPLYLHSFYQAAAILVGVPKWNTKRAQIGTSQVNDETETQEKSKKPKTEETDAEEDDIKINIDKLLEDDSF